jgi:hypothetical protein
MKRATVLFVVLAGALSVLPGCASTHTFTIAGHQVAEINTRLPGNDRLRNLFTGSGAGVLVKNRVGWCDLWGNNKFLLTLQPGETAFGRVGVEPIGQTVFLLLAQCYADKEETLLLGFGGFIYAYNAWYPQEQSWEITQSGIRRYPGMEGEMPFIPPSAAAMRQSAPRMFALPHIRMSGTFALQIANNSMDDLTIATRDAVVHIPPQRIYFMTWSAPLSAVRPNIIADLDGMKGPQQVRNVVPQTTIITGQQVIY